MGGTTNGGGAARRRPFLISITTAGLVAGLLSFSGVFAASTDRATTTGERVATGELVEPSDVDLQIAPVVNGGCATWQEDLTTGIFAVDATSDEDAIEGEPFSAQVCLRNHGPSEGTLSVLPIDLDDRELACTGREAEVDGSCLPDQGGELAQALELTTRVCGTPEPLDIGTLEEMAAGPRNLVALRGNDTVVRLCIEGQVLGEHLGAGDLRRRAQSDQVTWRFAFDLGAPGVGCQQLDDEPNGAYDHPQWIVPPVTVDGAVCPYDRDIFSFKFLGAAQNRAFTVELTWPADEGQLFLSVTPTPSGGTQPTIDAEGRVVYRVSRAGDYLWFATVRSSDPADPVPHYQLRVTPDSGVVIGPVGPG